MKKLVLFGAGGFGQEAAVMIGSINNSKPGTYDLLGYIVDSEYFVPDTIVNGLPVLGDVEWLTAHKNDVCCAIAIGDPKDRERVFHLLDDKDIQIETIVSPEVYIHPTCKIGRGCYIGYRTLLSVHTEIGDGVFINTDGMFGHHLKIGSFTTIWPRVTVSGNCTIGSHVEVGGGSYIIPHRKIGDHAVVAAGSVVFSNVKAETHVLGNPAKRITL